MHRRRRRSTGSSRLRSPAATPTARCPTRPTCRSSRSRVLAASGTACRRPTPRRSSSTCSCIVLLFALGRAASAIPRPASCSSTPGCASRSRRSRSSATPTTRSSRRSSSARCSPPARRRARGALAALASLAKFAPLALVPLLATHRLRERGLRGIVAFSLAFAVVAGARQRPGARCTTRSRPIYDRTISYQADRSAPFSLWGLYGGLGGGADRRAAVRDRARRRARGASRAATTLIGTRGRARPRR